MSNIHRKTGVIVLLLIALLLLLATTNNQQTNLAQGRSAAGVAGTETDATEFVLGDAVSAVAIPALATLPQYDGTVYLDREINPRMTVDTDIDGNWNYKGGPDALLGVQANAPEASDGGFLTPIFNFDGADYTGVNPPDTVGEVGANHYIQMINGGGTVVSIYDKTDASLLGQWALTTLPGCSTGGGDPIVLYDEDADRWFLSEFGAGNSLCVYVSDGPDPVNDGWFSYQFPTPTFPDYPKYGIWLDYYVVTINENPNTVVALDRVEMLQGNPATSQRFTLPELSGFGFQTFTPVDTDGPLPPAGSPAIFGRHIDNEAHGTTHCTAPAGQDCIELWELDVDFDTPANSTVTNIGDIFVTDFDSSLCGLTSFSCIDQPGGGADLDPLREVIMHRFQYRNFGSYEMLLGNLATDVSGNDDAGVRWFELRRDLTTEGGGWMLYQEGTYAPDSDSRWMAGSAMDASGNIAMGYNIASTATFPGLRYVGRLASDPVGTMPQGEGSIIEGTASNASNRYGDYSAMSIDPIDGCTFWFTGEYNDASTWSTRITAMRFDACGGDDFTVNATPNSQDICAGTDAMYNVDVGAIGDFTGDITLSTAGAPGVPSFSVNPVSAPGSSVLTIAGAAAGNYTFDIIGTYMITDRMDTVDLNVFASVPAAPTLVAPPDGATDVATSPMLSWNAVADATNYVVDVATDAAMTNIVYTANEAGTSHVVTGLAANTDYYWRITSENICGSIAPEGVSEVWMFTTANVTCSTPALAIPDNDPGGITDDLVVGSGPILTDLDVSLDISHTWVGDLAVTIEHVDTGTTVTLFDRPGVPGSTFGCADDNIAGTADDEGSIADIENHCTGSDPWVSTTFVPTTSLSAFDGESFAGTWRLFASDGAGGDTGTIDEWCLLPTGDPSAVEVSNVISDAGSNLTIIALIGLVATLTAGSLVFVNRRQES